MASFAAWASKRDEELGKKDDNYRPSQRAYPSLWTSSRTTHGGAPARPRRRRVIIILVVLGLIYLFHRWHSEPQRVIGNMGLRRGRNLHSLGEQKRAPEGPPPKVEPKSETKTQAKTQAGPPTEEYEGEAQHYYSGPIMFYNLRKSLDATRGTGGYRELNRNVLFAVSSLKSAANLLPLVCEMSSVDRNYVHLVFLGRVDLPVDDILALNGVERSTCKAYFHDGRPDYSEYSTDVRAEASVVGAMAHVHAWIHPQVVIIDDAEVEDAFFIRGIKGKMQGINRPVIELPAKRYQEFWWITRLNSAALGSWHKPRMEILVHSPSNAGGGLARLLKSLSEADYSGFQVPRLTVELPSESDPILTNFLNDFAWPPAKTRSRHDPDLLKIQKRIPSKRMSSEEASIRFVESYFPAHYFDEHVLVLSPNTALSPSYFQYMMSTLLQSRYSSFGMEARDILGGIMLTSPTNLLDGSGKFTPPPLTALRTTDKSVSLIDDGVTLPPYLWQAPSSDAMLVFGGRWAEFHDYLRRRLKSLHEHPQASKPTKAVSPSYPAWLEFFTELCRARGYMFLYPPDNPTGNWATVHQELRQTPEEFKTLHSSPRQPEEDEAAPAQAKSDEPFLVAQTSSLPPVELERVSNQALQPLHELLPFNGDLPPVDMLPLISLQGTPFDTFKELDQAAAEYTTQFRSTLGGCSPAQAKQPTKRVGLSAGDLFCLSGSDNDFDLPDLDMKLFKPGTRQSVDDWEDEDWELPPPKPNSRDKATEKPKKEEEAARIKAAAKADQVAAGKPAAKALADDPPSKAKNPPAIDDAAEAKEASAKGAAGEGETEDETPARVLKKAAGTAAHEA